jgi:hypothetical protein
MDEASEEEETCRRSRDSEALGGVGGGFEGRRKPRPVAIVWDRGKEDREGASCWEEVVVRVRVEREGREKEGAKWKDDA